MRRSLFALAALFILVISVCAQAADITVGVILSTTGPGASLGIPEKNTLAFVPSEIAGHKVRTVVYDDASDPTTAVQNVKRLINEDKVDVVIGPTIVTTALAVMDTISENKTPLISLAQPTSQIAPVDAKRRWMFKTPANESVYMTSVARHMAKLKIKTVSVIAFDDPYGEGNYAEFKKAADQLGIQVLAVEKYKRTDTTVMGQVLHAMQGKPDAVFIIASGSPAALPHTSLIDRGYKGKIYQTSGVINADFLRVGGKALEGAYLPASPVSVAEQLPNGYPTKVESLNFTKAYEAKFGPRVFFAGLAWDAINIVSHAIPKALKSGNPGTPEFREALRAAIETTKYNGATAVFAFSPTDHSGVNELGSVMVKIENGTWKLEDYPKFK
jgi:branched-chain amino acid transport system substrate-binding protein